MRNRNTKHISKSDLHEMYIGKKLSVHTISTQYKCSQQKVNYWLHKYGIPKRSISDAIYAHSNPTGDPFSLLPIVTTDDALLHGLGLGLYWGEGNKRNPNSVRLGNSDPVLIKIFVHFLIKRYAIDISKLRFGLQIFSDMDPQNVLRYWSRELKFPLSQFHKVIITPSRGAGTYLAKSKYGVLTVHFANTKLRDKLISEIEEAGSLSIDKRRYI